MNVKNAVFPGILAGSLAVFLIARLISPPNLVAIASNGQGAPGQSQPAGEPSSSKDQFARTGECSLPPSYPDAVRRWCGLIEKYARENSLDPRLIAAVMLQESGGNPEAISSSGAVGLMQIMPRDGAAAGFICKNGPCFASRPTIQELLDPEFNIAYGARMLSGLIKRHGDLREALKAYGPMDVDYRYADIILRILNKYD